MKQKKDQTQHTKRKEMLDDAVSRRHMMGISQQEGVLEVLPSCCS